MRPRSGGQGRKTGVFGSPRGHPNWRMAENCGWPRGCPRCAPGRDNGPDGLEVREGAIIEEWRKSAPTAAGPFRRRHRGTGSEVFGSPRGEGNWPPLKSAGRCRAIQRPHSGRSECLPIREGNLIEEWWKTADAAPRHAKCRPGCFSVLEGKVIGQSRRKAMTVPPGGWRKSAGATARSIQGVAPRGRLRGVWLSERAG